MKHFALIGHNIDYSLSPQIHSVIYEHIGVKATYKLISIAPDELENKVTSLKDLDGFNITKPHKEEIIQYCKKNNGGFDAVNTIKVDDNGDFIGNNTDYYGFYHHITNCIDLKGKRALVLGAGGVAKVVVPALVEAGASVFIYNRTYSTAQSLAEKFGAMAIENISDGKSDVVVNCTSVGLDGKQLAGEGLDLSGVELVYDTIYFETALLKKAKQCGANTTNGLKMLIYQAIKADEIFFDIEIADKDALADKIENILNE